MYECQSCDRMFAKWASCCQHMNALDHWADSDEGTSSTTSESDDSPQFECDTCTKCFWSQKAVEQHMNATDHWGPQYDCDTCTRSFWSQEVMEKHMYSNGHWEFWCDKCEQKFDDANSLQMHKKSSIHQGTNVKCPFCKRGFVTASGVSHHLETGSCHSARNVDRKHIYEQLSARDHEGVFTKKLIGWHDEEWEIDYAYNGSMYECYICHKEFRKHGHLEQHVKSPTHQQSIYHCPNKHCGSQFKTLAAMFNHLESESCRFMKFASVGRAVSNFFQGNRVIAF